MGSSKKEFLTFPDAVKGEMGNALGVAQFGGRHVSAKPSKGQRPGVFEVVEDYDGDTFRAVYTVRFGSARWFMSCTPSRRSRRAGFGRRNGISIWLKGVCNFHKRFIETAMEHGTITRGKGNVFADLGFRDAEERQTKLRLAYAINDVIARRRLTQAAAATGWNLFRDDWFTNGF